MYFSAYCFVQTEVAWQFLNDISYFLFLVNSCLVTPDLILVREHNETISNSLQVCLGCYFNCLSLGRYGKVLSLVDGN